MQLLVLGATSDIAKETARQFAQAEGANVYLAGRDLAALELLARDIEARSQVKASVVPFDAADFASHAAFYAALDPKPDVVLLAFGLLGEYIGRIYQEVRDRPRFVVKRIHKQL